jgi:hypothetical protein
MDQGGGRTDYYRVSVPGKEAYAKDGTISKDRGLTHIDIEENSLNDITAVIDKIRKGG